MSTAPPSTSSVRTIASSSATNGISAGFESRHAHVDRDLAVVPEHGHDHPARGLDANLALRREPLVADELDEAARAVAALLDLAAVGVEDPVAEIDVVARRGLDHQHLVAADAEAPVGEPAQLRRRQLQALPHAVEDDEIVAEPLHLGEPEPGHRFPPRTSPAGSSPLRAKGSRHPSCTMAVPFTS